MTIKHQRLLFLGREKNERPLPDLYDLLSALHASGHTLLLDRSIANILGGTTQQLTESGIASIASGDETDINLVVVLGGDGTFLGAARHYAPHGSDIVGVNLGYLGFLTDIARSNMQPALLEILAGNYHSESRFMQSITYNDVTLGTDLSVAINDVVINRGAAGTLLELRVTINNVLAYTLRADGLIISTPSGSTAYALSAGGPIVAPDLDAMLLVPLCPHALTHRPLVVRADYPIRIEVIQGEYATAHIDGQGDKPLAVGDIIEVSRHPMPLNICHPLSYDYYQTLRKKLLWGE